jgi:predicted membrane chloride channel (bestrophin family)
MGWKMFTVFTGLSGLVGCANSFTLPVFLFGCNFSLLIMKWSDPMLPILYRKIMFIVYAISIVIFLLLFVNYRKEEQYNFYSSALYVSGSLLRASCSLLRWESSKTVAT